MLQRRKHKALAPTPPPTKKTAAPPPPPQPREGARERFQELRPRHPRQEVCSSTSSLSRGTRPPPPLRSRPHPSLSPSSAASAPRPPPSRSRSSSSLSMREESPSTAERLKPGTRALVRTRTQTKIDRRTTLVVWLGATVVSVTADGYEVIYEGNLPRDNPFATVHVPLHHVKAFNPSPPTPPAAAIKIAAPKNQGIPPAPAPRPKIAEKSVRLIRDIAPETKKPAPRPTTAGKSIRVIRSLMSEKRQALDSYCLGY